MIRLALLAALCLTGCVSSSIRGKVIAGEVSYVVVAPSSDARFQGPGLEGALVVATIVRQGVPGSRASVVTDKDGWFSAPVEGASALADRIELEITLDGRVPARGSIQLPPADRSVIVLLKPGG